MPDAEGVTKKSLFGCRMCGQCALPVTGYVCPMGCPKAGLRLLHHPVDRRRWGESAWLNYWQGRDEGLWG